LQNILASRLPWQAEPAIIKFFEINYYGWLVGWLVGGTNQQPQPIANGAAVPIKWSVMLVLGLKQLFCRALALFAVSLALNKYFFEALALVMSAVSLALCLKSLLTSLQATN